MESTLEFLTSRKSGREVHRHWPDEVKAQIVSENLRPGAKVNEVAERFGLRANRLSSWRTMARQGKLVLPAPEDAVEIAAVIVDPPVSEPLINKTSRPRDHRRFGHDLPGRRRVCHPHRCRGACLRGSGMIFPSNRVRIMVATKPVEFRNGCRLVCNIAE
jgi:transposase